MAKRGPKPKQKPQTTDAKAQAARQGQAQGNGESTSGYFRRIFEEKPRLLKGRSNDELLQRWLEDNPGEKEVPDRVKYIVSNVKSVLRKKLRKGPGRPKKEEQAPEPATTTSAAPAEAAAHPLEALEEQIDECLTLARNLDRERLESVINLLRRARNEVVWKMGQ